MDGFKILEIAHRTAWKYKKSSDPHHSDTYTFNEFTMIDFAQKVTREMEIRILARICTDYSVSISEYLRSVYGWGNGVGVSNTPTFPD